MTEDPTPDVSEVERRLCRYHEWRARLAAVHEGEVSTCRIRKCRRDGSCTGPMVPSPHLEMAAKARALVGIKSDLRARLPICVAAERGQPDREYALILAAIDEALGMSACNDHFERKLKGRPWT
ncbi:hypothetical protein [Rhizobium halophytocola]|uniref:Uncharacterized protein n=1 Tax=Rhizobium halophytocola TaxID=735519 RepID=A0ABS4E5I1_9HYPH|nr:hypothetical protein [Rhizobium halophytocola]MBP1853159.1 hypothetical protein [Rhizobium halophytocola]